MTEPDYHEKEGDRRFQFLDIPNHHAENQCDDEVDSVFSKCFIPLRSISSASQTSKSPQYNLGSIKRKIYASAVSTESVYIKHKHDQSWRKKVLRKSLGIPFAALYYILLVWILSSFILEKSTVEEMDNDFDIASVRQDMCDVIFGRNTSNDEKTTDPLEFDSIQLGMKDLNESSQLELYNEYEASRISDVIMQWNKSSSFVPKLKMDNVPNVSRTSQRASEDHNKKVLFENDSLLLHVPLACFMTVVGVSSIFCRSIRATMLLILPGLITNRSRHIIFSIILGWLVNHPIKNIRLNFIKLLENSVCMYRVVVALGCIKEKETKLLWEYGKDTHAAFSKFYELAEKIRCTTMRWSGKTCSKVSYGPFPFPNATFSDFKTLTAPSTEGIKDQARIMIMMVGELEYYVEIARKLFTIVSIVILVSEAVRYLRSYYTDSSFDNDYVDRTTRKHWKKKNYYKESSEEIFKCIHASWDEDKGLRHWEMKEGLKTLNLPKCSKWLFYKMVRNCTSTFFILMFVFLVFVVDHFLIVALQYIKDNQKFHFTLEGFTQNITESINAELKEYSTKACLATPNFTSNNAILHVSFLLLLAITSCALQVLLSGIRAKLCSFFYPDRVEERADYLYFRIVTGRLNRKAELMLVIRREMERREKLLRISPFKKLREFFSLLTLGKQRKVFCPGCSRTVRKSKTSNLSLDMFNIGKKTNICNDCNLDLSRKYKSQEVIPTLLN